MYMSCSDIHRHNLVSLQKTHRLSRLCRKNSHGGTIPKLRRFWVILGFYEVVLGLYLGNIGIMEKNMDTT